MYYGYEYFRGHDNLITIHGIINRGNEYPWLVMECFGISLSDYLNENGRFLSIADKVQIIKGIANGIQRMHSLKFAHRDLKVW